MIRQYFWKVLLDNTEYGEVSHGSNIQVTTIKLDFNKDIAMVRSFYIVTFLESNIFEIGELNIGSLLVLIFNLKSCWSEYFTYGINRGRVLIDSYMDVYKHQI